MDRSPQVHARHEIEARRKDQSVDDRRNWLDLNAVYCMPIGPTATALHRG
jgi:hypothetical protein